MRERTATPARASGPGFRAPHPLGRFLCDCRGATAIEYAMIGGLIFAVIAGTLKLYGSRVDGVYSQIGSAISQVN